MNLTVYPSLKIVPRRVWLSSKMHMYMYIAPDIASKYQIN